MIGIIDIIGGLTVSRWLLTEHVWSNYKEINPVPEAALKQDFVIAATMP